jgi:hypothetical protein
VRDDMTKTFKVENGDFVIRRSSGQFVTIENTEKARQAARRLLELDGPWGADIRNLMGTVPDSATALSAEIQDNIRDAFNELTSLQSAFQLTYRTPEERLASIAQMFVVPAKFGNQTSKTGYAMRVDMLTVAGQTLEFGAVLNPAQGG